MAINTDPPPLWCSSDAVEVQPPEIISERWRNADGCLASIAGGPVKESRLLGMIFDYMWDEEITGEEVFKSWESNRDAEEDMNLNSVTGFFTWLHN